MRIEISLVVIAVGAALVVSACSTPYQEKGFMGGVSASQIDSTTLRISGRGNAFTDRATIQNYVLVKAAEETVAHGFGNFQIMSESDASRGGVFYTPGSSTSYTTGSATAYGYGNSATAYGTSTTNTYSTPGQAIPFTKPGEDILVRMYPGPKPTDAPPNVFDARDVLNYLGKEVRGY